MNRNITLDHIREVLSKKYKVSEMYGPGFTQADDSSIENPGLADRPYITHRVITPPDIKYKVRDIKRVREAEEDELETDEETPIEDEPAEEVPAEEVPAEAGGELDTGMGDTGMGMMGMPEEEEKDPTELGRIYELKKIYSRLTSIEGYLGTESAPELLEIRHHVSQAIELFEIVSSNFNSYKDKLPEIIVTYYRFIKEIYHQVKEFYKKQKNLGE